MRRPKSKTTPKIMVDLVANRQLIVVSLGVIIGLIGVGEFFVSDVLKSARQLERQEWMIRQAVEAEVSDDLPLIHDLEHDINQLYQVFENLHQNLEHARAAMLEATHVAVMVDVMASPITTVQPTLIEQIEMVGDADLERVVFQVEGQASYSEVFDYLEKINLSPRCLQIERFDIALNEKNVEQMSISLDVVGYRKRPQSLLLDMDMMEQPMQSVSYQ